MLRNALVAVSLLFVGGFVVALVNAQDFVRRSSARSVAAAADDSSVAKPSAPSGDAMPDPTRIAEPGAFAAPGGSMPARRLGTAPAGADAMELAPAELNSPLGAARQASATGEEPDGLRSVLKRRLEEQPAVEEDPSLVAPNSSSRRAAAGASVEGSGEAVGVDTVLGDGDESAVPVAPRELPANSAGEFSTATPRAIAPESEEPSSRFEPAPLRGATETMSPVDTGIESARRVASRPVPSQVAGTAAGETAQQGSVALLASEAPAVRVEARGPAAITVGKEAIYRVQAFNDGQRPATGLIVHVALPRTIQVAGSEATTGQIERQTIGVDAGHLVWNVDEIAAGSSAELRINLVPQQAQPFPLGVQWSFRPLVAAAQIQVQEPKLDISISGPKDILYGETKIYTLTLTNPGTGDAENVVITLGSNPASGATKQLGTLAAGERRELDVELTARDAGTMDIQAQALADGGLRSEAAISVRVRRAQLEVQVVGPAERFANSPGVYRVRVANVGDAVAQDVVAALSLPEGTQYVAGAAGAVAQAGRIQWPVGLLNPGAEKEFPLQFELILPGAKRFEARALAAGDLAAAHEVVTEVKALADLKLLVNDPRGPKSVGEDVAYEVTVMNRGTKSARQVTIVTQFSEGIEPTGAEGGEAEIVPGQVIFQPVAEIAPGERVVLKVLARADKEGNHIFRAEVQCVDPETRLVTEEATRYFASGMLGR